LAPEYSALFVVEVQFACLRLKRIPLSKRRVLREAGKGLTKSSSLTVGGRRNRGPRSYLFPILYISALGVVKALDLRTGRRPLSISLSGQSVLVLHQSSPCLVLSVLSLSLPTIWQALSTTVCAFGGWALSPALAWQVSIASSCCILERAQYLFARTVVCASPPTP
jgi:hypothetical protein